MSGDDDPDRLANLPGLLWDPRVEAFRAPAWRHAEVASGLAAGGVRFSDTVAAGLAGAPTWTPPSLRPYQQAALTAWQRRGRRGVIVLPTGAGKTRVAIAAIAQAGLPALCLVPTRVLLDQWWRALTAALPIPVGRLGDGVHDLRAVTVATYESGYRHMATLGDRFGLLVVDEVHHVGTSSRDEALEMSVAAARLGLTATPVTEPEARRRGEQLVGPVVYRLGALDLAGDYLAPFELVPLAITLTPAEQARYQRLVAEFRRVYTPWARAHPGARWRDFTLEAERSRAGQHALRAWLGSRRLVALCDGKRARVGELLASHRGSRVLIFVADNAAAYALARAHLVMPLTCDIGRAERAEALARFGRGELRALVSARVLNEGLDVPDADVAIIVAGALGEREHVQRVGRLLRPAAGKRALVYELVADDTHEVHQAARRRKGLVASRVAPAP